ncbi:diacylglycerol/lipid kinase family protein [Sunxiuqinia indica]|uniref:diacylglycerol/lipid kinase family protein n=1 Tax=Sunxiuqinia indica TaxID=2692584 RepID=UPI00135B4464|nr:diacylglycerol kinase family protein [Sunxiuqinia indica]
MPNMETSQNQKILFAINPISGDIDKNYLKEKIQAVFEDKHSEYEIFYTTGENDVEKITTVLAKYSPDRVVSVGGDGTFRLVGEVMLNKDIPIAILPLGSANGMATELGIPKNIDQALKVVTSTKKKSIDALRINDQHISFHLSDIGLNAQIIKRFENDDTRGFIGYAKHFFKELFTSKPNKYLMHIDGEKIIRKAHMIVLANASKYGTGAVINPKGIIDDGKFEIILIRPYSAWHLFHMIIPFFSRTIHELDYVDSYSCKKASIRNYKKKELQIDGELIGRIEEISVEIIPHALQILVPDQEAQSIFSRKLDSLFDKN